MKRKVILIALIVLLGLLLTGASLTLARLQHNNVEANASLNPSIFPAMNWERVTDNGFGYTETNIGAVTALDVFSGYLYAGTTAATTGTVIYRSSDGTSWVPVNEPGFGQPIPTSDPVCNAYWYYMWDTAVFSDELFVPTGIMCQDPTWFYYGGQVWRTEDGLSWTAVVTDAFGYTNTQAVNILKEFNGMLYAGTADTAEGLHIWRSASGDAGDWEDVTPGNLADPGQYYSSDFEVYNNMLFMTTNVITVTGISQVWYTADGITWEGGPMDMFTCEPNCLAGNLQIFSDTLYMGVWNFLTGGELWHTTNGITWTLAISTGDSNQYAIDTVGVFNGYLYVDIEGSSPGMGTLWRSSNGTDFELASLPGLDRTIGSTAFPNGAAIFQDHLYIGKYNWEIGGSIWRNAPLNFWLPLAFK